MEIFLLSTVLGFIYCWIFEIIMIEDKEIRNKYWDHHIPIFGYHMHHSMYGVVLILIGVISLIFSNSIALLFAGLGWGIILRHTKTDRKIVFVEKITFWDRIKGRFKWIK